MNFGRFEKLSNDGTTTHGQKSIHWDNLETASISLHGPRSMVRLIHLLAHEL